MLNMSTELPVRLESVIITNFRSIAGTITVPLSASTVLIHGLNGSGKTSILSAIELALTGTIDALERGDPNYKNYLTHFGAQSSEVVLDTTDTEGHSKFTTATIADSKVQVSPLLSPDCSHSFGERSYLVQAALGRLLEIYQHTEARDSDSALTRFVKELLSLDQLDALIDGLFAAGDLRRVRNLVPEFRAAEDRSDHLQANISIARKELTELRSQEKQLYDALINSVSDFLGSQTPEVVRDIEGLRQQLSQDQNQEISQVTKAIRELLSIQEDWSSLLADELANRKTIEAEGVLAAAAASDWKSNVGRILETTINSLRTQFPNLPSSALTDPLLAHNSALNAASQEVARCSRELDQDEKSATRILELSEQIGETRKRIRSLDDDIAKVVQNPRSLSAALAAILPHIHGTYCPVCGRDFSEVSAGSLPGKVSSQIAQLTADAATLQQLSKDRNTSESSLRTFERELETLTSRRLSEDARVLLRDRVKNLSAAAATMTNLAAAVAEGARILRRASAAEDRLAASASLEQRAGGIRKRLEQLWESSLEAKPDTLDSLVPAVHRLQNLLRHREAELSEKQQLRQKALEELERLEKLRTRLQNDQNVLQVQVAERNEVTTALETARGHRAFAKDLADLARNVRANIVRRVFDQSLNGIWRQLFVRLAPDEQFVPAFVVPRDGSGPVVAVLETFIAAEAPEARRR
jgi:exonuclease SbcC